MMKHALLATITVLVFSLSTLAGDKPLSEATKTDLQKILSEIKIKAPQKKQVKHKVSLPVASAGARASEVKAGTKFSVIWPGSDISPLAALAHALNYRLEQGKDIKEMQNTMAEFVKTFPEYKDEPLVKNLDQLLKSAK